MLYISLLSADKLVLDKSPDEAIVEEEGDATDEDEV